MGILVDLPLPPRPDVFNALRQHDTNLLKSYALGREDHPDFAPFGGWGAIQRLLENGSKGARRHRRKTWKRLATLLDGNAGDEEILLAAYQLASLPKLINAAARGVRLGGAVPYPLTTQERARLTVISERLPAFLDSERVRRLEEARRRSSEALEAKRRKDAEGQRLRLEADERRRLSEVEREAVNRKAIADALTKPPAARHRALIALVDAGCPSALVPGEAWAAAGTWDRMRREKAAASRAALKERRARESEQRGHAAEAPPSRHFQVTKGDGFVVAFEVPASLALGSQIRADLLLRRLRLAFGKAHVDEPGLLARFPIAGYDDLVAKLGIAEEAVDAFVPEALTPLMVEEALGISARERLKWTRAGRLPQCGTAVWRKGSREIIYALHSPDVVAQCVGRVEEWRASDAAVSTLNRKRGARDAAKTRMLLEEDRQAGRDRIDAMARQAAVGTGSLVAAPVIKLAIMAILSSRRARHHGRVGNLKARDRFQALLHEAIGVISAQEWSVTSWRPGHSPKVTVALCGRHRGEFRDASPNQWGGGAFEKWVGMNRGTVRSCRECRYDIDHTHTSQFEVRLEVGDTEFRFNVPYEEGRDWLPPREELPSVPQRKVGEDTGEVGGQLVEDELADLWQEARLAREFRAMIDLFKRPDQRQASTSTVRP